MIHKGDRSSVHDFYTQILYRQLFTLILIIYPCSLFFKPFSKDTHFEMYACTVDDKGLNDN